MGAYKGPAATLKDAESKEETFKKGGRTKKKVGGAMKGKKEMKCEGEKSEYRADRPARKSGGGVFSSAAGGQKRGAAANY